MHHRRFAHLLLYPVVAAIALSIPRSTLHAQAARPQPTRRSGFGLAYDSRRSRLVLYAGSDSAYNRLGDTWEWANGVWTQRQLDGPPARSDFAMTYDSRRARVVVFGGRTAAGLSNETWEFDGDGWTRADSGGGPSARNLVSMAFDAGRGHTVLFGGSSTPKDSATWEWDGQHWQRFAGSPADRRRAAHMRWSTIRRGSASCSLVDTSTTG